MKKRYILSFFLFWIFCDVSADHITGGEMYYSYDGFSGSTYNYTFTLKLYMRCNSGRSFNNPTIISIFEKGSMARVRDISVTLARQEIIQITDPDPCISNPPAVCYEVAYYDFQVSVPPSANGYVVAGQVNFRISGIANLSPGYSQIGATYTADIPGTAGSTSNVSNHSAKFVGSDLVIVCAGNAFQYSFAAIDSDKDELRYSFCEAYRSSTGPGGTGGSAAPPMSPPYESVPYGSSFSDGSPLGGRVSIDPETGLITGTAPGPGVYVVTVCVEEIRNGRVIAIQRKDLQIAITSCNLTAAILQPVYQLCDDTKTLTLSNLSASTLINSYSWEIRNQAGITMLKATTPNVTYTFPDTGLYSIKLLINPGDRCTDSTTSLARVYPGFKPGFSFAGICFTKPSGFTDATASAYGLVNSWLWDFDDAGVPDDVSSARNPVYTYQNAGIHAVKLVATNSKGCRDSVVTSVQIFEKPPVTLAFRDTLICPPDQLRLMATGRGQYSWSPNVQMVNANTATPTVSPLVTTKYYVDLDDDGCRNRDSVLVRVTNSVQVKAMNDTTICQGDRIQLSAVTNGLRYSWTPGTQLMNSFELMPTAITDNTTVYEVTAYISSCVAKDQVVVTTVPYPLVNAGADTIICFGTATRLSGSTNGSQFSWSPASSLNSSTILNPVARPSLSTTYVLSVTDNNGCPKPVADSVLVNVLPDIMAETGNDTAVVVGESVQLEATGGNNYFWYPPTGLSAVDISNPVALFEGPAEAIHYTVLVFNEAGCVDSAGLTIKVFGTPPSIFVPSGFTPNGDGKNDLLRPIAVGMKKIERFTVFNRYGQQVFSTTINGFGWDGRINGEIQPTSVYVWYAQAVDFNGKIYKARGTTTLVR